MNMAEFPTIRDVIALKHFLNQTLPMELVDLIVDLAEYWPHVTCAMKKPVKFPRKVSTNTTINGNVIMRTEVDLAPQGYEDTTEDGFLLRSPPLGALDSEVKSSLAQSVQKAQSGFLKNPHAVGIHATTDDAPARSAFMRVAEPLMHQEKLSGWLPPRGRSPARMIIFETVNYPRDCPPHREPNFWCHLRVSSGTLPGAVSPVLLAANIPTHVPTLPPPASGIRLNQSGILINTWRFDDDMNAFKPNTRELDQLVDAGILPADTDKKKYMDVALQKHRDRVDFFGKLKEADSIGAWARGTPGNYINVFEGLRMHVFWAV